MIDYITKQPVVTGGVMALGNFDGVHRGHQEVLRIAKQEAQKRGLPCHALTFSPHPYSMFKKDVGPFLLTRPEFKRQLLGHAGADHVVTLHFTPEFAGKSPEAFMQDVLIDGCAVKHIVVGFDFVFGHGRGGDREALRRRFEPLGIGVTEVPPYRDAGGEVISSTRIRSALRHGRPDLATTLLGRAFSVQGVVELGDQRGRTLLFPTANIDIGKIVRPAYGAYVIMAHRVGEDRLFKGIANVGKRPSVGDNKEVLEFHLFDFDEDIYGQEWDVAFYHFLRSEKPFPDMASLQAQIRMDAQAARVYFDRLAG